MDDKFTEKKSRDFLFFERKARKATEYDAEKSTVFEKITGNCNWKSCSETYRFSKDEPTKVTENQLGEFPFFEERADKNEPEK